MSDLSADKPAGRAGIGIGLLSRRAALLSPLALAGCETIDNWLNPKKDPLPGKREPVSTTQRGFRPDVGAPPVTLPTPVLDTGWPQAGGNPGHLMGHLSLGDPAKRIWSSDLGAGGGYRAKILAQPVVANGIVFAMDSNSVVTAFDLSTGARLWRTETVKEDTESSNVGGGLCWEAGTLYATNGMAELLALDPAGGKIKWRHNMDVSARSAPTIAMGRIFLTTIDSKLLALSPDDGHVLWSYQATAVNTTLLGSPAPAFASNLVVAGFGSGEIAALHADNGAIVWTDGLGLLQGRSTLVDFLAIKGEPVISNGQIFVTGLGGLTIAADLLTGRRVWERRVASGNTPYIAGDWMYILSVNEEVGAINVNDARIAWVSQLPRWENPEKKKDPITWFGPVLAGNRLLFVGTNKQILSVNPLTGETLGAQVLSGVPAPFPPVIVDATMLIVTDDGMLSAWR